MKNGFSKWISNHGQSHKPIYDHDFIPNTSNAVIEALSKTTNNTKKNELILYISLALSMPARFYTNNNLFNKFIKLDVVKSYFSKLQFNMNNLNGETTKATTNKIQANLNKFRSKIEPLDDNVAQFVLYAKGVAMDLIHSKSNKKSNNQKQNKTK